MKFATFATAVAVLVLAPSFASPQSARSHVVTSIVVDGKPVEASSDVVVTPNGKAALHAIRRGETIDDGTRVDVPAGVDVTIASTGAKSSVELQPGSSLTFVETGKGELVRSNGGHAIFDVVHGALDFFRVQYGTQITAGVEGTKFWIDASPHNVVVTCQTDRITVTRTGYITAGLARKPVILSDVVSATGKRQASYAIASGDLAHFGTFADAFAFYDAQVTAARSSGDRYAEMQALANRGYVEFAGGELSTALVTLHDAIEIAREFDDLESGARIARYLGLVLVAKGLFPQAQQFFEATLDEFRELGDRDGEAQSLNDLGIAHERQSDYAAALDAHRQAEAIFAEVDDVDGRARATLDGGIALQDLARNDEARIAFERARDLFAIAGDRDGIAVVQASLGGLLSNDGKYEQSIDLDNEALALFRELGDRDREASTLTQIAFDQQHLGRYDDALASLQKAVDLERDVKDLDAMANVLVTLGDLYVARKEYDRALAVFQVARNAYHQLGEPGAEAAAELDAAVAQTGKGDYDAALQSDRAALAVATSTADVLLTAQIDFNIGRVRLAQGKLDDALAAFGLAAAAYDKGKSFDDEARVYDNIGGADERKNDDAAALTAYAKALALFATAKSHGSAVDDARKNYDRLKARLSNPAANPPPSAGPEPNATPSPAPAPSTTPYP